MNLLHLSLNQVVLLTSAARSDIVLCNRNYCFTQQLPVLNASLLGSFTGCPCFLCRGKTIMSWSPGSSDWFVVL